MAIKTNIQRQKGTRRKPDVGDVFGIRVPPRGWLFGRVVRTDALRIPDFVLVYIFAVIQAGPTPIPPLNKRKLLLPPMIVNPHAWTGGYFVTLLESELRPGDAYERHCFESHLGGYIDEFWNKVEVPFEPCGGDDGLHSVGFVDDRISEALGLPIVPQNEKEIRRGSLSGPREGRRLAGPGGVAMYLPMKRAGKAGVERIEVRLREAVEKAKAGLWEGHGFDLERNVFDTRFESRSVKKLIDALRGAVTELKGRLPDGWYATVRSGDDGEEHRIEFEPNTSA